MPAAPAHFPHPCDDSYSDISMGSPWPRAQYAARLLDWYDDNRRDLAWRAPPGTVPDPYHVWLSEIMLQQTGVVTVAPYYRSFLARWPRIEALAAAPLDTVLAAWAGLGYYARARNLHRCAQILVARHNGVFPQTVEALRALPGIGRYTAAAIAAIAFGQAAAVVDGNIERVLARLFAVTRPLPDAKDQLYHLAQALTPPARSGDYAQGMMDLGASLCAPRTPRCEPCPLRAGCLAHQRGDMASFPRKRPKPARPVKYGTVFWVTHGDAVLLRKRPASGLLGGMMEMPGSAWLPDPPAPDAWVNAAPLAASWERLAGEVRHSFTHFDLRLTVMATRLAGQSAVDSGLWCQIDQLRQQALPTLFVKVARFALEVCRGDAVPPAPREWLFIP